MQGCTARRLSENLDVSIAHTATRQLNWLIRKMASAVADPSQNRQIYLRVAEAVVAGQIPEAELAAICQWINQSRRTGKLRKPAGAAFNGWCRRMERERCAAIFRR